MDKLPMTAAGHAALEAEFLRRQQVERPRIVAAISEARSHGDLSENAEYHSAKEAQSHNEGRIVELEDLLQRAEVIDVSKLNGASIKFGATVTLIDEDTEKQRVFQIVGESEADVKSGPPPYTPTKVGRWDPPFGGTHPSRKRGIGEREGITEKRKGPADE